MYSINKTISKSRKNDIEIKGFLLKSSEKARPTLSTAANHVMIAGKKQEGY
jgi:hypothetical protein